RVDLEALAEPATAPDAHLLDLDDALDRLARSHPRAAELVKLKFFAGLTLHESAAALGLPPRSADRLWAFARAWLADALHPGCPGIRNEFRKSWRTPSPDGALEVGTRRPLMNDAEERLMTVFLAALERGSAGERQAYLDQACADDPALRHRVEALLRAHDRA